MTRLQVNVPLEVKEEFEEIASEYGMDLSNAVRYMMIQFNMGEFRPSVASNPKPEKLSRKAEARYDKMVEEAKMGKNVSKAFDNVDEMLDYLHNAQLDE